MLPDKLQHQQLVEIRIQQRSRNRIELPVMVMRASSKVNDHVAAILLNPALIFSDQNRQQSQAKPSSQPANSKTTAQGSIERLINSPI
jgi:hypothetical protein